MTMMMCFYFYVFLGVARKSKEIEWLRWLRCKGYWPMWRDNVDYRKEVWLNLKILILESLCWRFLGHGPQFPKSYKITAQIGDWGPHHPPCHLMGPVPLFITCDQWLVFIQSILTTWCEMFAILFFFLQIVCMNLFLFDYMPLC